MPVNDKLYKLADNEREALLKAVRYIHNMKKNQVRENIKASPSYDTARMPHGSSQYESSGLNSHVASVGAVNTSGGFVNVNNAGGNTSTFPANAKQNLSISFAQLKQ